MPFAKEEMRVRAAVMRAEGRSLTQISHELGVSVSTVWRWQNPEAARAENFARRAAKTAWQNKHDRSSAGRKKCSACGQLAGTGSAKKQHGPQLCQSCIHATAEVRRTLAEGMWADGWSLRSMADAFGVANVQYFMGMRRRGWDLPRRYKRRAA